jgi:hypothetical protein
MSGEIKQRHHIKAMIFAGLFLIVCISFIMWLKDQSAQQPVPTTVAINDVKSTDWKKYGTDEDGDHFYRFDESGNAFPDVLSVKTKLVYSEEGKKAYIEKRRAARISDQGFDELSSRTVLYGLNCVSKTKEFCVLEVFELTKEGKTLDYAKTGSYKNWNPIPQGTVYENLSRIICPGPEEKSQ